MNWIKFMETNYKSYILNGVLSKEEAIEYIKESLEINWKADPIRTYDWAEKIVNEIVNGTEESYEVVNKQVMTEILGSRKVCPSCGNVVL